MSGSKLARASPPGGPLRCCLTDGALAVAGCESGELQLWDVALMSGSASTALSGVHSAGAPAWEVTMAPSPDGLYPPWRPPGSAAINGLSVLQSGEHDDVLIACACDDGNVILTGI